MTQHTTELRTPLPWHSAAMCNDGPEHGIFADKGGCLIAVVTAENTDDDVEVVEADAGYIAKACNNYPAMLEVLRRVKDEAEKAISDHSDRDHYMTGNRLDSIVEKAREVLAAIDQAEPQMGGSIGVTVGDTSNLHGHNFGKRGACRCGAVEGSESAKMGCGLPASMSERGGR